MLFNHEHAAAIRMPLIDVALAFDCLPVARGDNLRGEIKTVRISIVRSGRIRIDHHDVRFGS